VELYLHSPIHLHGVVLRDNFTFSWEMLATIHFRLFYLPSRFKNLKIKIYRIKTVPGSLFRCETWSFTLRKEHRLRAFENRVPRRILGPKRQEVAGGWRRLHYEELHKFTLRQILFC
jgi:hypothetical protein